MENKNLVFGKYLVYGLFALGFVIISIRISSFEISNQTTETPVETVIKTEKCTVENPDPILCKEEADRMGVLYGKTVKYQEYINKKAEAYRAIGKIGEKQELEITTETGSTEKLN